MTKDGKYLYVNIHMDKEIAVYEIQKGGGDLELLDRIEVGSHVDNIEIDRDSGHLWLGEIEALFYFSIT